VANVLIPIPSRSVTYQHNQWLSAKVRQLSAFERESEISLRVAPTKHAGADALNEDACQPGSEREAERMTQQSAEMVVTTAAAARATAAARMRLHRERRRAGLRCLTIELRETEIDVLIGKGLLSGEMRNDPRVVCQALYAHLDRTLGSTP
jgi:hypothetical protein